MLFHVRLSFSFAITADFETFRLIARNCGREKGVGGGKGVLN